MKKNEPVEINDLDNHVVADPALLIEKSPETSSEPSNNKEEKSPSLIDIGKSMVSSGFSSKETLLSLTLEILDDLSNFDKKDYPAREDALLFFKNTKDFDFVAEHENLLIKNGILISTSVSEVAPIFSLLEIGTVLITLPHYTEGTDRKIIHPSAALTKSETEFWRHNKFLKRDVKNEELIAFDTELLRNQ